MQETKNSHTYITSSRSWQLNLLLTSRVSLPQAKPYLKIGTKVTPKGVTPSKAILLQVIDPGWMVRFSDNENISLSWLEARAKQ